VSGADRKDRRRAGAYPRVSTGHQEVDNQRRDVGQLVLARGCDVATSFEENVSSTKERPESKRMMAAARADNIDVLAVWSLDLLGRSMLGNIETVR
jgi:DNA invertase Pin-like site-specific DNA recombinase